jgi:hypothetical protein
MSEDKPVSEMKKDDLSEYAIAEHGVELDMTKPVKELRDYVAALDEKKASGGPKEAAADEEVFSTHLKHPVNGRVYLSTPGLRARKDMIPCNAKGKAV